MEPDDELCLCFHVTRRKVEQFLRARRPAVASQLSQCYGAGTGCGWCRPFLQRLHAQVLTADQADPPAPGPSSSPAASASQGGTEAAEEAATGPACDPLSDDLPDASSYAEARAAYRNKTTADPQDK